MWIKCLAQGHSILMSGFEPSNTVSRERHSKHMTGMLHNVNVTPLLSNEEKSYTGMCITCLNGYSDIHTTNVCDGVYVIIHVNENV